MMKLLGTLITLAIIYAAYTSDRAKTDEILRLKNEVEQLKSQIENLTEANQAQNARALPVETPNQNPELQARLNAEVARLQAFQKRKDLILAAINDPAKASSLSEERDEIREKNEEIQSLQLQLTANQNDEKMVDHGGEQAKQNQNVSKAQALADINASIRAQVALIARTETTIRSRRNAATADSMAETENLRARLAQQKIDLDSMKATQDQIAVASAVQTSQIHAQVGYEKSAIHASEQEIRAQILTLKNEIKALESQAQGATHSTADLKQQAAYLDKQIAAEKTEIERIKALLR